jgi:iron complex transport system ATP-binding protein
VLDRLDLTALAMRRAGELSGGERQRVVLARALAQQAPVLLLDEPTTALDLGHQQQVLELVDRLRRADGLTVVTTMHDLTVAGLYADALLLLAEGRAVASGRPGQVLTEALVGRHFDAHVKIEPGPDGRPVVPGGGGDAARGPAVGVRARLADDLLRDARRGDRGAGVDPERAGGGRILTDGPR